MLVTERFSSIPQTIVIISGKWSTANACNLDKSNPLWLGKYLKDIPCVRNLIEDEVRTRPLKPTCSSYVM